LSANNRWVGTLESDKLNLFDATAKLRAGPTFPCSGAFAFGPRADQFAVVEENNLSICDLTTNETRILPHTGEITLVKFMDEETLVATTGSEVILLDIASGKVTKWFRDQEYVTALATSPDGKTVAIGDSQGNVILWDTTTGDSSIVQVPGRSGYPWTPPAGILAALALYAYSRRKRPISGQVVQH